MRNTVEKVVSALVISATLAACGKSPSVDNQAIQKAANTPAISSPDNRTNLPTLETDASHTIVIPSMTPFLPETVMTATATVEPKIEATQTATKTEFDPQVENANVMKRVKEFYAGTIDYRGTNEENLYTAFDGHKVQLSEFEEPGNGTFDGHKVALDGHGKVAVHRLELMTVLLGVVQDDQREYLIFGSEKNGNKLVWSSVAGYLDKTAYPALSWVDVNENKTNPPMWGARSDQLLKTRSDLRTLYDWLKPAVGKPVEAMVVVSAKVIDGGAPVCGGLNANECDFYYNQMGFQSGEKLYKWFKGENVDINSLPFVIKPDETDFARLKDLRDNVLTKDIRIPSQRSN